MTSALIADQTPGRFAFNLRIEGGFVSERDGSRDFDPLVGEWNIHLRRLLHPLSGSKEWAEFKGTSRCHSIWDGRAQVDELATVNPVDGSKTEGLTLRLYSPQSHEWRLYWANSKTATFGTPQVGRFVDGTGEFLDKDVFEGKEIVVRYLWTELKTDSPKFEQAFSPDGGKTWEPNWVTVQTRR